MNNPPSPLRLLPTSSRLRRTGWRDRLINFLCLSLSLLGATVQGMNNPEKKLIEAAFRGDLKEAERLIAQGVSVEAKINFHMNPLISAARFGHEDMCKMLIENKASVVARDIIGQTPLIWAVRSGHEAVCRLLIDEQLKLARQNKAAIIAFLGIMRKRPEKLPCQMQKDIAQLIARQAFETVKRDKKPVIEQINRLGYDQPKDEWLAYIHQQMNLPYDMSVDFPGPNSNSEPDMKRAKISE